MALRLDRPVERPRPKDERPGLAGRLRRWRRARAERAAELARFDHSGTQPPPSEAARLRARDEWRMVLVIVAFGAAYATTGVKMGLAALAVPEEPRLARSVGAPPVRAEIVDRNGHMLAGNLPAWSLYAHPQEISDPAAATRDLAEIFPELDAEKLYGDLTSGRRFLWVKRPITPKQKQQVHDLGRPGLFFGRRTVRVYTAGNPVAHIVGGVQAAKEGVHFTELAGAGGAEAFFDERLRDPARADEPLALSIDLGAQMALREVLSDGMKRLTAKGAAGILLDVRTGEILAMVSLPDFDPNTGPEPFDGPPDLSPRFNRAALGRYELGSTFKPLTAAVAMDLGLVGPQTLVETKGPLYYGRMRIRDFHGMPPHMTVTDIIRRSSNVGSARMAQMIGTERFKAYLDRLGFFAPTGIELSEASHAKPLYPTGKKWTDLSTMTMSYGHGLAASPLHLAAAYATLGSGGLKVTPTLRKGGNPPGERVMSERAARATLQMLREVVRRGTGRRAEVEGYEIGGKTGTADKVRRDGRGYHTDKVIATFASVFPVSDPSYALIVTLDEPTNRDGPRPIREASRTAVPLVGEAVKRIAPILGLRPLKPETRPVTAGVPGGRVTEVGGRG